MIAKIDGIDNVRSIAAVLEKSEQRVSRRGADLVRRTAARIEALAKQNAPVDSGHLRGSISTDLEGDGRSGSMTAEIGPTASYGGYVELGTSRQAPQPYLFPAADRVEPGYVAAMQKLADLDV